MSDSGSTPSLLDRILNHTRLLMWSIDESFHLMVCNKPFSYWMEHVYGIKVHRGIDIINANREINPQAATFWKQKYQHILDTGMPSSFQMSFYVENQNREVLIELYPVIQLGQVIGITGFARNITEEEHSKSKIENELREANIQLQNMLEHTQDMVFSLNQSLEYTGFNQRHKQTIEELFQGSPRIGSPIAECSPVYASSIATHIEYVLETERFYNKEISYGKGITKCYFDTMIHPIFGDNQQLSGVSVFVRDTTARRKAEQQAQKGIRLFSSINRNITEAIFRSTPDGKIKYINQAFLNIFKLSSRAEALSTKVESFYAVPDGRKAIVETMEEHGSITNWEIAFKRADGTHFTGLLSSTKSINERGDIYFDGAIRDITDLKQAQIALEERNAELRSTNSALDKFVYTASHDLKAPLGSISGLISIFRMDKDESRREQYLDKMEQSVAKLENFISDIVDYSRNSRQEIQQTEVDLDQVITDLIEELRYMPNASEIDLAYQPSNQVILTDKSRLEAILKNLISNAISYADLEKESPFVNVISNIDDSSVDIQVIDNGLGIEESHQEKIFDMFYRASEGGSGSGIGLFIVKEAVEKLGGEIHVESAPYKGTTFNISLPLDTP